MLNPELISQVSKEQYTLEVRNYMDTMEFTKFQAKSDFVKKSKKQ